MHVSALVQVSYSSRICVCRWEGIAERVVQGEFDDPLIEANLPPTQVELNKIPTENPEHFFRYNGKPGQGAHKFANVVWPQVTAVEEDAPSRQVPEQKKGNYDVDSSSSSGGSVYSGHSTDIGDDSDASADDSDASASRSGDASNTSVADKGKPSTNDRHDRENPLAELAADAAALSASLQQQQKTPRQRQTKQLPTSPNAATTAATTCTPATQPTTATTATTPTSATTATSAASAVTTTAAAAAAHAAPPDSERAAAAEPKAMTPSTTETSKATRSAPPSGVPRSCPPYEVCASDAIKLLADLRRNPRFARYVEAKKVAIFTDVPYARAGRDTTSGVALSLDDCQVRSQPWGGSWIAGGRGGLTGVLHRHWWTRVCP